MGTDIWMVTQAKLDGKWVDVENTLNDRRHYNMFAHLAGVRNGAGFAGVVTGSPIEPIQEGRGFPDDFDMTGEYHDEQWMGDHSFGWVSADEINAHRWAQGHNTGIITIDQYRSWDGGYPGGWCGDISGRTVVVAETKEQVNDTTTHVRVSWPRDADEFDYFVDEIKNLSEQHGEIRVVFGFDS